MADILMSEKQQKCDFTNKYELHDACDTPKNWLKISLKFSIFSILGKSWKFAQKVKQVIFKSTTIAA